MDSNHYSLLGRIIPLEPVKSNFNFNKEKYHDMLLDAAETILSTFGFSREAYGIPTTSSSWLTELRKETKKERELKALTEEPDF